MADGANRTVTLDRRVVAYRLKVFTHREISVLPAGGSDTVGNLRLLGYNSRG
jgi:hypothetical protein